jgi:hypothetical protein
MNKLYRVLVTCLMTGLLVGCSGQPIKIASVTDQSTIDKTRGREIMASAAGFHLFNVFPLTVNNRQQRAYEVLLQKAGNDAITDVTVQETWRYGFIGTIYRTTLRAMAYPRIAKAKAPEVVQPPAQK